MRALALSRLAALAVALACACGGARADTPIALFKSFAGNVNFTGTQRTMRTKPNSNSNAQDACTVVSANTPISATLSGLPAGATVLSAQLYWAASNSTRDNTVTFDGATVSAPAARQYFSSTIGGGYDYYGGAADVTAQVAAKGNGSYTFYGVNVNNGDPYCSVQGVVGGFSLLVIYSHPNEAFRVLNLYEGFQYIRYSGVTLTLGNFRVPDPIGSLTGRLGHVTWEGDTTLGLNGEDLLFNGTEMTDALNPPQNQFNSASNINGDPASHGIDFDAYTVGTPVIQSGQTQATTRYQSGQDLVLLNAEIIAVPNVPVADLGIAITLDGTLTLGQTGTYRLTVANNGPLPEGGPIVVTDSLPAQFTQVSAGGSGWTCNVAGQVVTCTTPGALAVGASLPPIAISGTVTGVGSGSITNSASVDGQMFDNASGNNSASVSASISAPAYIFTDGACDDGKAFGSAGQCKILGMPSLAAGSAFTGLYITALNSSGVPTARNKKDSNVSMRFGLSCVNPATGAGTQATFTSAPGPLPGCEANGAIPGGSELSAAVSLLFKGGSPSVNVANSFSYADVGRIELFGIDSGGGILRTGPFVSYPASLKITMVKRNRDGLFNPAAGAGGSAFLKAGEPFTIIAGAYAADGTHLTPNFGKEGATISLVQGAVPGLLSIPPLNGGFGAISGGQASGNAFSWDEAGAITLAAKLTTDDYLGTGTGSISRPAITVGRFYPDHFDTAVNAPPMPCMPNMACPASANGAAYAGQRFPVTVTARNAAGKTVLNYGSVVVDVSTTVVWSGKVALSAFSQPGGAVQNPPAGGGPLALVPAPVPPAAPAISAAAFKSGEATLDQASGLSYQLPNPYLSSSPRTTGWTGPTPVYIRADSVEPSVDSTGKAVTLPLSSLRGAGTVEGGITIVSGRLKLSNAHGSELLKMPVRMEAQYWTAPTAALPAYWETNLKDNASVVSPVAATFANCQKGLQKIPPSTVCKDAPVLELAYTAPVALKDGAGTLWLKAPGAGALGSTDFQVFNPPWLPSTVARMVFGIYKSPLIYLREVY